MSKLVKFGALLVALSYLAYLGIGANGLRGLTTIDLVYAAISYEDAPAYIRPAILQRALAKSALERQLSSGGVNDHGAFNLSAGLPLALAHYKYSELLDSPNRAKERNRALELTEMLWEYGIDMEAVDKSGCTALQSMALFGDREFYDYLLALGADPHAANDDAPAVNCRRPAKELATRAWSDTEQG